MITGVYLHKKYKKMSTIGRLNISDSRKGKVHSSITKEKMRISHLGKKYKPMSEKGKENIKNSHIGLKRNYKTRMKIRRSHLGKKNHNWKGGASKDRHNGNELRYRRWRSRIFQRDNWTCQTCGLRSGIGMRIYLEAHHIKSWSKFPGLRYILDNGITLCRECHKLTDNYKGKNL